jgi:hypothetical protein
LIAWPHIRRQIGAAEFRAGRQYQRIDEQAGRGVKSGSLEPRVQYGHVDRVPDAMLIAARRLRLLDGKIVLAHGVVGIVVLRANRGVGAEEDYPAVR